VNKRMIKRIEPGAGFADRVMERVEQEERRKKLALWPASNQNWLRWTAAAALIVMLAGGEYVEQQRRQREIAGEKAREQLMIALQITSTQLQQVQARFEAGEDSNPKQNAPKKSK